VSHLGLIVCGGHGGVGPVAGDLVGLAFEAGEEVVRFAVGAAGLVACGYERLALGDDRVVAGAERLELTGRQACLVVGEGVRVRASIRRAG
jgi:hypothetical protein